MSFEKVTIDTEIPTLETELVENGVWEGVNMTNALTALRPSLTRASVNLGVIAVDHVKDYVDRNVGKLADHYNEFAEDTHDTVEDQARQINELRNQVDHLAQLITEQSRLLVAYKEPWIKFPLASLKEEVLEVSGNHVCRNHRPSLGQTVVWL